MDLWISLLYILHMLHMDYETSHWVQKWPFVLTMTDASVVSNGSQILSHTQVVSLNHVIVGDIPTTFYQIKLHISVVG